MKTADENDRVPANVRDAALNLLLAVAVLLAALRMLG